MPKHGKQSRQEWLDMLGLTRGTVQTYDVYRCSDREKVMDGVQAETAARYARVSVNFVVTTAKRPARNKYGRVASETGYYFVHHADVRPKQPDDPRKKEIVLYRIKKDLFVSLMKRRKITSICAMCVECHVSYDTLIKHLRGIGFSPSNSSAAWRICSVLGIPWRDLYERIL